jgi:hypothetical protein
VSKFYGDRGQVLLLPDKKIEYEEFKKPIGWVGLFEANGGVLEDILSPHIVWSRSD